MKICFTADTWQNALANEARAGCAKSNIAMTGKFLSSARGDVKPLGTTPRR